MQTLADDGLIRVTGGAEDCGHYFDRLVSLEDEKKAVSVWDPESFRLALDIVNTRTAGANCEVRKRRETARKSG